MAKQKGNPKKSKKVNESYSFPIVGMGASAGGLEALEGFFSNMPSSSNMAFVDNPALSP